MNLAPRAAHLWWVAIEAPGAPIALNARVGAAMT
jgi:hypothetical protein